MNETTTETTFETKKSNKPFLFWALALLALGLFVYFVFMTDKVSAPQNVTIPDGSAVAIEGLPTDDTTVVATVNGREVTQGQVNEFINSELVARGVNFADLPAEEQASMQSTSLDLMIEYTLLLQAAEAANVEVDRAETEAQIEQIKSQFSGDEFASQLAQLDITEARLVDTIHNSRLIDVYIQSAVLNEEVVVTEAEIDAQFAEIVEQNGGEEAFAEQLAAAGMDTAALRESLRESITAEKEQALVEAHIASLRASVEITQ